MGKKRVTLQMIADQAQVSVVTVSNVLAGKKGASEEMRKKILALAEELGYQSTAKEIDGRRIEKGQGRLIGVLIAERYVKETPSFYMDIFRKIAQKASLGKCLTLLEIVGDRQERGQESRVLFGDTHLDGILIIGEMRSSFVDWVRRELEVPLVCVDFYDIDKELDFIITDGFEGMRQLTQKLIDMGHREILFVGNPRATVSIMDRYMGYCKAMTLSGLAVREPISDRDETDGNGELSVVLPEKIPEAFVCNCEKAAGLLRYKLMERGISIPEDVSVAAFDRVRGKYEDGIEWLSYESEEDLLAAISVSTLLRRIDGHRGGIGIRMVEGELKIGNTARKRL